MRLCVYIFVWTLSMILYETLHIMCQHIYVHSIALCAPDSLFTGIPPISVSAQYMSFSPGDDQGVRGLLPTVCAYSFSICRIQISHVYFIVMWALSQSCIPAFYLQFMCITWLWMHINQYLFLVQVNQYFYSVPVKSVFIIITSSASTVCFVSIEISRFSFSYFFLPY